ncbi:Tn3 family transposase [Streptomyces sp. NBS 14/10]|nr:transposase [Streptomyces sp. NBS 14/10]KAK1177905.1 Tn3 family transposase [Streptomyces sp. NBS 14/10]
MTRPRHRSLTDATASALPAQTTPVHPFAPDTLWTTKYIDAAVSQLQAEGHEIRDEDIARLSPLKHRNLNLLGRYSFTASTPAAGALRPLRDPEAQELDEDDDGGPP